MGYSTSKLERKRLQKPERKRLRELERARERSVMMEDTIAALRCEIEAMQNVAGTAKSLSHGIDVEAVEKDRQTSSSNDIALEVGEDEGSLHQNPIQIGAELPYIIQIHGDLENLATSHTHDTDGYVATLLPQFFRIRSSKKTKRRSLGYAVPKRRSGSYGNRDSQ